MCCSLVAFGQHKHSADKEESNSTQHRLPETPLKQSGNDIFDAIQEVVEELKADPQTDWEKVDLESLRQHLLDMKAFTEEVEVKEQQPIEKGIKMIVKPESSRAEKALKNMLSMHPKMMKMERGWDMNAEKKDSTWEIAVTTDNTDEVPLIRGLGYIGIVVEGAHHQVHLWMMATGKGHH